jgi:hypothetical protein
MPTNKLRFYLVTAVLWLLATVTGAFAQPATTRPVARSRLAGRDRMGRVFQQFDEARLA